MTSSRYGAATGTGSILAASIRPRATRAKGQRSRSRPELTPIRTRTDGRRSSLRTRALGNDVVPTGRQERRFGSVGADEQALATRDHADP